MLLLSIWSLFKYFLKYLLHVYIRIFQKHNIQNILQRYIQICPSLLRLIVRKYMFTDFHLLQILFWFWNSQELTCTEHFIKGNGNNQNIGNGNIYVFNPTRKFKLKVKSINKMSWKTISTSFILYLYKICQPAQ